MTKRTSVAIAVLASLLVIALAGRLLPHPPNFAPIAAIALFGGYFFRRAWIAVLAVVGVMFATDAIIGFYDFRIMLPVYAALALPAAFGPWLRRRKSALRIGSFALCGAVSFFLISNFAVWLFTPYYGSGIAGLMECYTAAIPFFKWTLAGDLAWSSTFFASEWALRKIPTMIREEALSPELQTQG